MQSVSRMAAVVSLLAALVLVLVVGACRARPEKGRLNVVSYPRGTLVVDGHDTGVQTPTPRFDVSAGRHVVTVHGGEGTRFAPQTVEVHENTTTHLYFRSRPEVPASDEVCTRGPERDCWARIGAVLSSGDRAKAAELARAYLVAFPDDDNAEEAEAIANGGYR